jgi:hypothetical protein
VAADAAGDVAVAFTTPQSPPSPYEPAAVATLPAGAAAFGAPQVFAPEGEDLAVFGGPGGFALGYGLQGTEPWRLEISGVGGAPLTAATIDASDYRTGFEGPVVALPARGGALVAWTVSHFASEEAESPNRAALYATTQQTGGGLAAPAQLAPRRALAQHLLAAATRETAILAWSEGRFGHQRLRYAVRGADGRVTRPRTLARRADGSDLSAAGDRAIATWMTGHAVRFARLDG